MVRFPLAILLMIVAPAAAQLRIVSLNSSNTSSSTPGPRTGMDTILEAIGSTVSDDPLIPGNSGIVRPIDILCLQESNPTSTATAYANELNRIYATSRYAAGTLTGATTGSGTQVVVFNTDAVSLISMAAIGTATTSGQPRQTLRYQFRPKPYIAAGGDLWIYNAHFKAGSTATDEARRLVEAEAIRTNADALPAGNVMYLGDFNVSSSAEAAYSRLLAAGPSAAVDPIESPGIWNNNASFKAIHTQSPFDPSLNTGFNGTSGGMDDRFDFQLVSSSIVSGTAGLQYAVNSYNAFGNNGSHDMNRSINFGTGGTPAVRTALAGILDHLPVVADYLLRPHAGLAYPGDATLDRTVSLDDFTALAANFGSTAAWWQQGDFTDDGSVSLDDFTVLASNFGGSYSGEAPRSVPEPGVVAILAGLLVARRKRR